jgi:hypothetical protein
VRTFRHPTFAAVVLLFVWTSLSMLGAVELVRVLGIALTFAGVLVVGTWVDTERSTTYVWDLALGCTLTLHGVLVWSGSRLLASHPMQHLPVLVALGASAWLLSASAQRAARTGQPRRIAARAPAAPVAHG